MRLIGRDALVALMEARNMSNPHPATNHHPDQQRSQPSNASDPTNDGDHRPAHR